MSTPQSINTDMDRISQRISKKEQIEMRRQLEVMTNRVKMLKIYQQRCENKQLQTEQKLEHVNTIRNQYHEYLIQQRKHKQIREHSLDQFREKTKQLKQQNANLKFQIRESVQQQKRQQFELMKKQSIDYDRSISLYKERSKSYNIEKKQKIQQYEQEQQMHLAIYKQQRMEQFKSFHKKAVLASFKQKAYDFMKIQELWEKEQEMLEQLNESQRIK